MRRSVRGQGLLAPAAALLLPGAWRAVWVALLLAGLIAVEVDRQPELRARCLGALPLASLGERDALAEAHARGLAAARRALEAGRLRQARRLLALLEAEGDAGHREPRAALDERVRRASARAWVARLIDDVGPVLVATRGQTVTGAPDPAPTYRELAWLVLDQAIAGRERESAPWGQLLERLATLDRDPRLQVALLGWVGRRAPPRSMGALAGWARDERRRLPVRRAALGAIGGIADRHPPGEQSASAAGAIEALCLAGDRELASRAVDTTLRLRREGAPAALQRLRERLSAAERARLTQRLRIWRTDSARSGRHHLERERFAQALRAVRPRRYLDPQLPPLLEAEALVGLDRRQDAFALLLPYRQPRVGDRLVELLDGMTWSQVEAIRDRHFADPADRLRWEVLAVRLRHPEARQR